MQVDNFDAAWRALDEDPTNQQWQKEKPGERFAMMEEVFYS